jgi:primosomal protein N' (replication factor Y)
MIPGSWYADVILPLPLPGFFTYRIPSGLESRVKPGMRVTVQFGNRKLYTAMVSKVYQETPSGYDIKELITLLDDHPVVNELQLKLWEWMAGYYLCFPGDIFRAALPAGLKLESETRVFAESNYSGSADIPENDRHILQLISNYGEASISDLQKAGGKKDIMPALKQLYEKKLIVMEEKVLETFKPRMLIMIRLTGSWSHKDKLHSLLDSLNKAPQQGKLVNRYLTLSEYTEKKPAAWMDKARVLKGIKSGQSALNSLVRKGIFELRNQEVSRLGIPDLEIQEPVPLNDKQKNALEEIRSGIEKRDVVLLHGVTSSGKTEIYIHLIREELAKGRQVLYLIPEIALTTQIIARLRRVFGARVGIYHSRFSDNERVEIWGNLSGNAKTKVEPYQIILGARSALFLPFERLGLVIVDEEHENTYKQSDPSPRYHARDTAIMLARLHGAKVLLGSATPSLDSYYNCHAGKYRMVELNSRYLDMELPDITLVNLGEAYRKKQMRSHFSLTLLDAIERSLKNREQVILFQNRRGFSIYLACEECGWVPHCRHCDVSLTYHKKDKSLVCHYCGNSISPPSCCSGCGSTKLQMKGLGTEQVEEEIALFFPGARVARLDMDTARSRKSMERIITGIEQQKTDILVGTQMISKGLDFDNVSLVGILNADNMLHYPDFRAYEKSFQLMMQVSGRAGRKNTRGRVIIQAFDTGQELYGHLMNNDYKSFAMSQLTERKQFGYPPYTRLIEIMVKHKDSSTAKQAAEQLAMLLRKGLRSQVMGPEYPLVGKIQNYYLQRILIKTNKEDSIIRVKQVLTASVEQMKTQQELSAARIMVDVDPG